MSQSRHPWYLQQLWNDGENIRIADINGIISVRLLLVSDVAQVKDGWQQRKDSARRGEEKKRTTSLVKIYVNKFWSFWAGVWDVSDSLFSCGWQEPHHLHGQLQTLKVVLQILSFHCEAVLLVSRSNESPAIKRITAVRGFPKGAVTRRTSISLHIAAFQLKHAQHVRCIHVSSRASHTNTQSVSIQMFLQMFRDLYLLSTPQTWKCFHPLWLPEY